MSCRKLLDPTTYTRTQTHTDNTRLAGSLIIWCWQEGLWKTFDYFSVTANSISLTNYFCYFAGKFYTVGVDTCSAAGRVWSPNLSEKKSTKAEVTYAFTSGSSVKVRCSLVQSVTRCVLLVQFEGFNKAFGGLRLVTVLARFPFPFKHTATFRAVSYGCWYIFIYRRNRL